jgi:hypothetical protein
MGTDQQEFDFERRSSTKEAPVEIVEKIKKLLRLAADKSNRHEAELALRRAFELARRHSIGEGIVEGQPEHTMRHFIQEVLPVRNTATARIRRDVTLLTLHSIDCASKGEEMPDIPNQYLGAERFIDAQREGWDLVESVCPEFAPVRPIKTPSAEPKKASAPAPKKSVSLLVAAAPSRQLSMQERIDALKASHRRVYS